MNAFTLWTCATYFRIPMIPSPGRELARIYSYKKWGNAAHALQYESHIYFCSTGKDYYPSLEQPTVRIPKNTMEHI